MALWLCLRTFCLRVLRVTGVLSDQPKLTLRTSDYVITAEALSLVPANYTWMSCSSANDRYVRLRPVGRGVPPEFLSDPRPVVKQLRVRVLDRDRQRFGDRLRRLLQEESAGLLQQAAGQRKPFQVLPDQLGGPLVRKSESVSAAAPVCK